MSLFPKFNPWAEIAETSNRAAKVAKVARVQITVSSRVSKPSSTAWDASDWQSYFDERAAIAEIDGKLSQSEAEALAYECCVVQWMNLNPPPENGPECCVQCGNPMDDLAALPFLTGAGGHVWMHSGCHTPWMRRRQAEAAGALRHMGIVLPNC